MLLQLSPYTLYGDAARVGLGSPINRSVESLHSGVMSSWWTKRFAIVNVSWWTVLLLALGGVALLVLNRSPDYGLASAAILVALVTQGHGQSEALKR